jgi:hypothetical protein
MSVSVTLLVQAESVPVSNPLAKIKSVVVVKRRVSVTAARLLDGSYR